MWIEGRREQGSAARGLDCASPPMRSIRPTRRGGAARMTADRSDPQCLGPVIICYYGSIMAASCALTSITARLVASPRYHFWLVTRTLCALGSLHERSSSQIPPSSTSSWPSQSGRDSMLRSPVALCTSANKRPQTRSPNRSASADNACAAGIHKGRKLTFSCAGEGYISDCETNVDEQTDQLASARRRLRHGHRRW